MRRIKASAGVWAHLQAMCDRPLILLLVDDQPLREALGFALETEGYAVSARADGRAVAAVVIDDDAADWPEVGERPTIVLTGDVERFLRRGVRGVSLVEKPLLGDVLSELLGELLKSAPSCRPDRSAAKSRDPGATALHRPLGPG